MTHPWSEITLTAAQQSAFGEIETLLARGTPQMPICLVGEFGSGKTTLARYWLARHFDEPESHYCPLNRLLVEELKREGDLDHLANVPQKARLILQVALSDFVDRRAAAQDTFVLDALEILEPYQVSPLPFLREAVRRGKIALICVPESEPSGFRFALRPFECHMIRV